MIVAAVLSLPPWPNRCPAGNELNARERGDSIKARLDSWNANCGSCRPIPTECKA